MFSVIEVLIFGMFIGITFAIACFALYRAERKK